MEFNPTFEEFLKAKKDITVVGLGWALIWRTYLVIAGVSVVIAFLGSLSSK